MTELLRHDFTKPAPPPPTPDQLRTRVAQLRKKHADAKHTLERGVACDDGYSDLNALSRSVHAAARELEQAEEQLRTVEAVEAAQQNQRKRTRFEQVKTELRESRAQFADLYKQASLALGRWYALRQEARELANSLADRLGNGSSYYPPHVQELLTDANLAPNPLPALRDARYQEIPVALHERVTHQLVPLQEKR